MTPMTLNRIHAGMVEDVRVYSYPSLVWGVKSVNGKYPCESPGAED